MKKSKIVLSIALIAILIMTMGITVFAAAPDVSVSKSTAENGETVSFTITTTDAGLEASITPSTNLEFVEISGGFYSTEGKAIILNTAGDFGGGNSVTYTYKINGAVDETYSLTVSNIVVSDNSGNESPVEEDITVSGKIIAAPVTTPEPAEPTPEPTVKPSENPTPTSAPSASNDTNNDELDDVPKTGDATMANGMVLMVVMLAAASVAIVAGKKMVSHK